MFIYQNITHKLNFFIKIIFIYWFSYCFIKYFFLIPCYLTFLNHFLLLVLTIYLADSLHLLIRLLINSLRIIYLLYQKNFIFFGTLFLLIFFILFILIFFFLFLLFLLILIDLKLIIFIIKFIDIQIFQFIKRIL